MKLRHAIGASFDPGRHRMDNRKGHDEADKTKERKVASPAAATQ